MFMQTKQSRFFRSGVLFQNLYQIELVALQNRLSIAIEMTGPNPTTFEFTTTTPAL
jgi:hypothetical protein